MCKTLMYILYKSISKSLALKLLHKNTRLLHLFKSYKFRGISGHLACLIPGGPILLKILILYNWYYKFYLWLYLHGTDRDLSHKYWILSWSDRHKFLQSWLTHISLQLLKADL